MARKGYTAGITDDDAWLRGGRHWICRFCAWGARCREPGLTYLARHTLGQAGADLVGLGDAEVGVERKCLVPVIEGADLIVLCLHQLGDPVVSAGLFVAIARLLGPLERGPIARRGLSHPSYFAQGITELVQRNGFDVRLADRAPEDNGSLQVLDRDVVLT